MEPDRRVLTVLYRRSTADRRTLVIRARLSEATLRVCLPKLVRMGMITGDDAGYRLTGRGRAKAKELLGITGPA